MWSKPALTAATICRIWNHASTLKYERLPPSTPRSYGETHTGNSFMEVALIRSAALGPVVADAASSGRKS
jgi:hypothetical protein